MLVRFFTALFIITAPVPIAAHDFWLEPETFHAAPGEAVHIHFLVGHAGDRRDWNVRSDRIVSLLKSGPDGDADLNGTISADKQRSGANAVATKPGTYLVSLESTEAFSTLPAKQFNAYLLEEGLMPALEYRKANGEIDSSGREVYSRRAKALLQIGDSKSDNVTKTIGQTLEIVPLANPYALANDAPLPVQVLYNGAPLEGARVTLQNLRIAIMPGAEAITDKNGHVSFEFPKRGAWKLNTVWTRPLSGNDKTDFETIFSSLSFGFDQ